MGVFSRLMCTDLLQTKNVEEVTAAFRRIQRAARGSKAIKGMIHVIPHEVSTDSGAEFKGPFSEMLDKGDLPPLQGVCQ